MLQVIITAFLTMITVGCGPRYVDYFPYHDDGTQKPKVALMPIVDSTQNSLAWDLTEEISEGIFYQLMNSGEFYVVPPREMGPGWVKKDSSDFFSDDISYVADFQNTDFIVSMEVIERSVVALDPCMPTNLTMNIRLRIKILDIRFCEPKIVLYEVFKTCYTGFIKNGDVENGIFWKDSGYTRSFCGAAHQRLVYNLSKRLEEVIWSVK